MCYLIIYIQKNHIALAEPPGFHWWTDIARFLSESNNMILSGHRLNFVCNTSNQVTSCH